MAPKNLATKILEAHLVEGELIPGKEIALKIDHTLLQDATGTMAMLEFMAMGVPRVKVELAAQYIDHNLLQTDNRNADAFAPDEIGSHQLLPPLIALPPEPTSGLRGLTGPPILFSVP